MERRPADVEGDATGMSVRLSDCFAPGQRVWVSTLTAESAVLKEELQAAPERAAHVTFMGVQFPGIDTTDYPALHSDARLWGAFMTSAMRRGLAEGRGQLLALEYQALARVLCEMEPVDVALAHVSAPDRDGWCTPGVACDFLPLVWSSARKRLAHVNPAMPRTRGSFRIHVSELDGMVEAERPLTPFKERAATGIEQRIGAHVASLVHDGDTLQFGIGGIPLAVAGALTSHRVLRMHSGMVTRALQDLWEHCALDRDHRITAGVILGDATFVDFASQLEALWLTDVRHTHDPAFVGSIPRFVAINGAIEVDLFGQVNAERTVDGLVAGAGGMPAFAQGALRSPQGRLVICLASTARAGASKIVPALGPHALCTLPRHMADTVVTEHGVAQVRGLPLDARAEALIAIAAPEQRDGLANAWAAMRAAL